MAPGVILGVLPDSGQIGTLVTITGTSMLGVVDNVETALLNGIDATVTSASNSEIVLEVISGDAGTGSIAIHCYVCLVRRG